MNNQENFLAVAENKNNKTDVQGTFEQIPVQTKTFNCVPPGTFKRNQYGLLENVDYIFNEDNTVNWRAMVPKEHLYLNKQNKEHLERKYGKKFEEIDIVNDKVDDVDLVVKLGGLRYLAALRGYDEIFFRIAYASESYVITSCDISWINNYESTVPTPKEDSYSMLRTAGIGSASFLNVSENFRSYLAEISENRAFCRAVRSFLRINIVSQEELPQKGTSLQEANTGNAQTSDLSHLSPITLLTSILESKNISFDKFKALLLRDAQTDDEKEVIKNYNAVNDIPTIKIFEIIGKIKAKEEKKAQQKS